MALADKLMVERAAATFGEDVQRAAQTLDDTRDMGTLRDILSLASDAIGVATGIYFVVKYLTNPAANARDAAIQALRGDVESLPPKERAIGNKIIDSVRSALDKP